MITIPEYDKVLNGEMEYKELKPNGTLFGAYRSSCDCKNDLLDFNEVIWDNDIDTMVDFFAEHSIAEFTISSTFSGLTKVLGMLEERGFKITGTIKVNAPYTDWDTGKPAKIYAVHLKKGED